MMNNQAKKGFTLIELLMVALIIGILLSVALPHYNKTVRKSRLTEVATMFNSISKGINAYMLENESYLLKDVNFSGTKKNVLLDIDIPCESESNDMCYTRVGGWRYLCTVYTCTIHFQPKYNANGTSGNKWLDSNQSLELVWERDHYNQDSTWFLISRLDFSDADIKKEFCRWWRDFYGADRIINSAYDDCAPYL